MIQKLQPITEPRVTIEFDTAPHIYRYKGKPLTSVTTWCKEYTDTFDALMMSTRCAQKWDEDAEAIQDLWGSNGSVTSGFGTAIHALIEHWDTHKKLGARIEKKGNKDANAALPKHPFLRSLLEELDALRADDENLITHQEVLVSDVTLGICGLVDNLLITDRVRKTCRVRDYKITHSIDKKESELKEPFAYLGDTKLAKNWLQLSVYSYLLSRNGWKVEGCDVYNWNAVWNRFSLDEKTLKKTMVLVSAELSR